MPTVRPYRAQQQIQPAQAPQRGRVGTPQLQTPILNVNPTPEAFGAAAGQTALALGAQGFGQELQYQEQQHQLAKAQQDRVRLLEADRQLSDWENRTLYDPQNGALNVHGKNAFGLPEQVSDSFEKTYDEISQGLSSDQQRLAFAALAQTRRSDVQSTMLRHVSKEMNDFEATEQVAYLENSREAAAANAMDPPRVWKEIQRQEQAIRSFGQAHGMGAEWIQDQTAKAKSQTHVDVLSRMVDLGNDLDAEQYYKAYKDEILGTARGPIEKTLGDGSRRGQAQRETARIMQDFATESEALAEAHQVRDPLIQDDVVSRVTREWTQKKQTERENQEAAGVQAKQLLDATILQMSNLIDLKKPVFARDVVPRAIWDALPHASREALESYSKKYQEKPAGIETDPGTYYALRLKASDDRQKFANINLLDYIHKLDKSDFKQLVDLQMSIRKGDVEASNKQLSRFRTTEQILSDTWDELGIPRPKEGTEEFKARGRVHRLVAEEELRFEEREGRKPTDKEVKSIVDRFLLNAPAFKAGSYLSILPGGAPFYDLKFDKRGLNITTADLPVGVREEIVNRLTREGFDATEDNVIRMYLEGVQVLQPKK